MYVNFFALGSFLELLYSCIPWSLFTFRVFIFCFLWLNFWNCVKIAFIVFWIGSFNIFFLVILKITRPNLKMYRVSYLIKNSRFLKEIQKIFVLLLFNSWYNNFDNLQINFWVDLAPHYCFGRNNLHLQYIISFSLTQFRTFL